MELNPELKKGDRVICHYMEGDSLRVPFGTSGTVMEIEKVPFGVGYQYRMKWDNGSSLTLIPETDMWILESDDIVGKDDLNESVEKLKTALSSVVQIFSPIIDILASVAGLISKITSNSYVLGTILTTIALVQIPKLAFGLLGISTSIKGMTTGISIFGRALQSAFTGGGIKGFMDTLKAHFAKFNYKTIQLSLSKGYVMVDIQTNILFASGKYELTKQSDVVLKELFCII